MHPSRALYWIGIALAVPAVVVSGFNSSFSRGLWTAALCAILAAVALTFRPPLAFVLAGAVVVAVPLIVYVLTVPHWLALTFSILVVAAWIWMFVAMPLWRRRPSSSPPHA